MADDWASERRQTAYEEARAVVEAQNATMQDIDEKAMRTVRITIVVIGILVTAAEIRAGLFHPLLFPTGLVCLLGSIIMGVVTYDESNLYLGPDGPYIEELASDATYSNGWDRDLLETYSGIIRENYDLISRNAAALRATNVLLVVGVVVIAIAVVI